MEEKDEGEGEQEEQKEDTVIVERYHFWCSLGDTKINLYCQKYKMTSIDIVNGNFSRRKGRREFNSDRCEECVKSVGKK